MPAPFRIWRDPTRKDVEELCEEKGGRLFVRPAFHLPPGARSFYYQSRHEGQTVNMWIGVALKGARPDWRDMLQKLGSDWA